MRSLCCDLVTFGHAAEIRLQLAMVRVFLRSRMYCGPPVASSLVVWVELSEWRGFSYLELLALVALGMSTRRTDSARLDNKRVTKEQKQSRCRTRRMTDAGRMEDLGGVDNAQAGQVGRRPRLHI